MKNSISIAIVLALIVAVGGWYWWYSSNAVPATPVTETTTPETNSSPVISQIGERCGGNMTNAPVCITGSHCAPNPDSNLPFGDVGGSCVADNTAQYVEGNVLLGADSNATLGKYLIAYNGMTLYYYTKDTANVSNCYDQCAVAWPPYVVASTSALSNIQAGITGKVGSTVRTDGSIQVTYNGKPLYFYVKDAHAGDATGQNVGKVWFVLKP